MVQRVPDEYFRARAAESDDVGPQQPPRRMPQSSAVRSVAPGRVREGVAWRPLVVTLVLAVAISFVLGRAFLFPPIPRVQPPQPTAAPSATVTPTALPRSTPEQAASVVRVVTATGACLEDTGEPVVSALVDGDASTIWRCPGDGAGEAIDFGFGRKVQLIGVRLVNGNTAWPDRYLAERQITRIRWTFPDGSFFEQGLAVNGRGPQEVRFPPVRTNGARLEVVSATPPGEEGERVDAVSISLLEFLGPS